MSVGRKSIAVAICGLGIMPSPLLAQQVKDPSPTHPQATQSGLQEIVVTAQRRGENLQTVPISVAAFTDAEIQARGSTTTDDLVRTVPGVTVMRVAKGASQFIRGVGSQDNATGNESAVANYIDGVYIMDFNGGIFSLRNIERVEILKGPQGTLFGRNATGGLIHIITRDPKPGFSVEGQIGYSNYETIEASAYVTGGTERLATDISAYVIRQGDGYGINVDTGNKTNFAKQAMIRSKTVWRPSDDDKFTFLAEWSSNQDVFAIARQVVEGGRIIINKPRRGGDFDTGGSIDARTTKSSNWGVSARWEHDLDFGTVSFLSAYRSNHVEFQYDNDINADQFLTNIYVIDKTHSFQNELTLTGELGRLNYATGFFHMTGQAGFEPISLRADSPAANTDLYSRSNLTSYAVFAQGTYAVTDTTKVTLGARYTIDTRRATGERFAAPGFTAAPVGDLIESRIDKATYKKPTWRIAIDQELADDVLIYASYNRGFKSGLFNVSDLGGNSVGPEKIDAYEAGIKSEFLDIFRLNISAFLYNYKNIQLLRSNPLGVGNILQNAAAGRSKGFELETTITPPVGAGRLRFDAGLSVLDAKYRSFDDGPISIPQAAGGNAFTFGDLAGYRMIRSPKFTFNASVDYAIDAGPGELGLNATWYHNDGFYWEADNRLRQDAYDDVNASIRYAFGDDKQYMVRFWVKNLLDKIWFTYVQANSFGDFTSGARPRTYGANFSFKF